MFRCEIGWVEEKIRTRNPRQTTDPSESLAGQAYYLIRERILRGELTPGMVLPSRRLAEELGMSLQPVSEALRQLEADKLVESRPRAGTRVRVPRPEEVQGRCIVREALEAQSARLCCEKATMKERMELQRLAKHLDTLYDRLGRDHDSELQYAVHTAHFDFHMRIAESARCPELKDAIEKNQILIYNWFFDLAANRRSLPRDFHAHLAQAITASDPLAADEAMRVHVRYRATEALRDKPPVVATDWRIKRPRKR